MNDHALLRPCDVPAAPDPLVRRTGCGLRSHVGGLVEVPGEGGLVIAVTETATVRDGSVETVLGPTAFASVVRINRQLAELLQRRAGLGERISVVGGETSLEEAQA